MQHNRRIFEGLVVDVWNRVYSEEIRNKVMEYVKEYNANGAVFEVVLASAEYNFDYAEKKILNCNPRFPFKG